VVPFTINYLATGGTFGGGINLSTGSAADTVNVQSTLAGGTTTVNTGGGNDTINVSSNAPTNTGNLAGLAGTLTVDGGAGANQLNVSESGSATADTVLVTNNQISSAVVPFTINYLATGGTFGGGINLSTGSAADTVNVQSTLAGGTTTVNTGGGNDTINVSSNAPTNTGNLAGLAGTLTVDGGAGANQLNVSESGSATADTVLVTNNQIASAVVPFTINYLATGGTFGGGINLSTGSAADTVNVQSTLGGGTTTVNSGGSDTINVSSNAPTNTGTLGGLAGALTVNARAGSNQLNVSESGSATADTVLVTNNRISSALVPFTINYFLAGGTFGGGINLSTGSAADTVNVQSTLGGGTTTVNTGDGNDTINVSSNAPVDTGTLAGMAGPLTVHGGNFTPGNTILTLHPNGTPVSNAQPAGNVLNISDAASPTANTYTLTGGTAASSSMPAVINFDTVQTLNLNAGTGNDTITSSNTTVGNVTLNGGSGTNRITVNATGPASNTVVNSGPGNDTLVVNGTGTAAFTQLNGGAGNDSFSITQTGGGSVTEVNGIGGTNSTTIGPLLPLISGLVAVHGGPGNDQLLVDDRADTTGRFGVLTSNTITGLGMPAGIDYDPITALTIELGQGSDSFEIASTHSGTTLVEGNGGDDFFSLLAMSGRTSLTGGSGNDTFSFGNAGKNPANPPADLHGGTIDGGSGFNVLNYEVYTIPVRVNLTSTTAFTLPTGQGFLLPAANSATGTGGVANIEAVIGTTAPDFIVGGAGDRLEGRGGGDILLGLGGNDTIIGGAGNDIIFGGGPGGNLLEASPALAGTPSDGRDLLESVGNFNTLMGGAGNDTIATFMGNNNVLFGGAGNNFLTANGNQNTLFGGSIADLQADSTDPNFIAPGMNVLTSNGTAGTSSNNLLLIDSCVEFQMGNLTLNVEPLGGGQLGLAADPLSAKFGATQLQSQTLLGALERTFVPELSVPPPDPVPTSDAAAEAADPSHNHIQVELGFLNSGENRSSEIAGYYQKYLGRTADQSGLSYWLSQFRSGATSDSVLANILASGEYYAKSGNTNASFIEALYHDLLGRTPGQTEVDSWLGVLGHVGRKGVALGFLMSNEYRSDLISSWYAAYLGRGADPAGMAYWLARFQQGQSQEDIKAAILASGEYQARVSAQFAANPKIAFLLGLYRDVLHRTASTPEVNYWLTVLSAF
jgi:Ca2+-binding RTX toxin-like protein